jgi:hypothetical protein
VFNNRRRAVSDSTKEKISASLKQRAALVGSPTTSEESLKNAIQHTRGKFRKEPRGPF